MFLEKHADLYDVKYWQDVQERLRKGEIVTVNGKNHHINVAQKFVYNKYFWSRPVNMSHQKF